MCTARARPRKASATSTIAKAPHVPSVRPSRYLAYHWAMKPGGSGTGNLVNLTTSGSATRVATSGRCSSPSGTKRTCRVPVRSSCMYSLLRWRSSGSGPVEGLGVGEGAAQPGLVAAQDADLEVRLPLGYGRLDLVISGKPEAETAVVGRVAEQGDQRLA